MRFTVSLCRLLLLVALGAAAAVGATAQTVWRCGPDGRSYQQQPCDAGRSVDVSDTRSAADVAEARAQQARERRLVRELVDERRAREREVKALGSQLLGIRPTPEVDLTPREATWQPVQSTRPLPARRPPPAAGTSRAAARETRPMKG